MTRNPLSTRMPSRFVVLVLAAVMLVVVFALRQAVTAPGFAITLLFDVPVALIAMAFGLWAGVAAATIALLLFAFGDSTAPIRIHGMATYTNAVGYLFRAVSLYLLAILGVYSDRLRAANKQFRDTVDAAPDATVVVDKHGHIVLATMQAERLLGHTRNELLELNIEALMPGRFRDRHVGDRASFFSAPHARPMGDGLELYALRKDGHEIPVEISLSPLETKEGPFVTAALRDVSERKRAERALREGDRLKTTLLRSAAHDFRSPLTAIATAGETSALPGLDIETRRELSRIIVGEANRLSRVVGKLLDLSRLQAGSAAPHRVNCSIEPIISAALDQVGGDQTGFSLALDSELPEVCVDPVQLERVFVNLLENCNRFAREAPVRVQGEALNGRLVVRVTDDGPGIPSGESEHIFEPFARIEDGRAGEGSGLGLAIVKGFVEANGGRVFVESPASGDGAMFVVEFPAVTKLRVAVATSQ